MVVSADRSSSCWIPPAQAIVYMESGEVKYFPPRNRGGLPRALTFHDDHAEWSNIRGCPLNNYETDNMGHSAYVSEECHMSYLVAENATKADIDDPPEEYQSFEHEYSQHSILKETISIVNSEVPSMSTPTEQYTNLLRHKKQAFQSTSMLPPNQSTSIHLSSGAATVNCHSPLIHANNDSYLSLDTLIDIYTQRMNGARMAQMPVAEINSSRDNEADGSTSSDAQAVDNDSREMNGSDREATTGNSNAPHCFQPHADSDIRGGYTPIVLRPIDSELLAQNLEELFSDNNSNSSEEGFTSEWLCLSVNEWEALLLRCCNRTVAYEVMEE